MKREEFIRRYGERKYREHIERSKAYAKKRKEEGRKPVQRESTKDYTTVTAYLITPDVEDYGEQLIAIDRKASKFQQYIRRVWAERTSQRFILTVDSTNKEKGGKRFKTKITLTQLSMDRDTRDEFKEVVLNESKTF